MIKIVVLNGGVFNFICFCKLFCYMYVVFDMIGFDRMLIKWLRIGCKVILNNVLCFLWGLYNIRWYIKNCLINIDIYIGNLIKFYWIIKKVISVYNMI